MDRGSAIVESNGHSLSQETDQNGDNDEDGKKKKRKNKDDDGKRRKRRRRKNKDDEADEDCKDGMIEDPLDTKKLVVHFYKPAKMTKKRCRSACKKKKKCKAFDYDHNECRGVSKIGNPRFGENEDERKFCTMDKMEMPDDGSGSG